MAQHKTIAEIALDVMAKHEVVTLGWGDTGFLDEIASMATHTNLLKKLPLARHGLILDALGRSNKFDKYYTSLGWKLSNTRRFFLKGKGPDRQPSTIR